MSDAVIYQAAAAAMVETYCDEVNERIRQDAAQRGMYCRPQFSPGYGDFPIAHQRDFSRLLDTPRKIEADRDRKLSAGTYQVGNGGDRSV